MARPHSQRWPTQRLPRAAHSLTDRDGATGLYTPYINFHLETIPGEAQVRVHADLHIARFAALPSSYVPRRGSHPATVTVLLHADSGFVTSAERRMLVQASATIHGRGDEARWKWSPGVSKLLALLTRHRYPDPDLLRTAPRRSPRTATPPSQRSRFTAAE
ncbi:DUF3962 domain-containing protein [Streptomyces sp. M10(2022)]